MTRYAYLILLSMPLILAAVPALGQQRTDAPDIVVDGVLPPTDDTYRVDAVEVGPLGGRKLLDTPYSTPHDAEREAAARKLKAYLLTAAAQRLLSRYGFVRR